MRNIELRPWRMEDALTLPRFANNPKIACNLRDVFPYPYTRKDAEEYLAYCVAQGDEQALLRAIVVDGQAAGGIALKVGIDVARKSAELGYWLAEDFWGQGVMTRAVMEICRDGWRRFDLARIFAQPFARNLGSRRVLEKSGFVLEGVLKNSVYKNGCLLDSCMYALTKEGK